MTNNGIVSIHGKNYMTVARRLELAHQDKVLEGVITEVLAHEPVVIKAVVTLKGKEYTGISAVIPENAKMIERQNPYEVAETSAVGRALGFAGYGLLESVASADEVVRATSESPKLADGTKRILACLVCGSQAVLKEGITQKGKKYKGIICTTGNKNHTKWFYATQS